MTTSDPTSVAQKNQARYIRGRDNGHADYVKDAARFDGIYTGEGHWDPSDKAKLDKEGRPALTFNMVLAVINTALGAHIKRDVQITFKPRRRASAQVASVLNKLTMQILHANRFKYLEMSVAADGLIQDRGFYDIRMDFTDHMQGEVKLTSVDPTTVVLDIDAKEYDPSTWNEVATTRWMSLDEIAGKYGKGKADQIKGLAAAGTRSSSKRTPSASRSRRAAPTSTTTRRSKTPATSARCEWLSVSTTSGPSSACSSTLIPAIWPRCRAAGTTRRRKHSLRRPVR